MYYLINSSLRIGEEIGVEIVDTAKISTSNISCINTLQSDKTVLVSLLDDILSNTTGEKFSCSLTSNSNVVINSTNCQFKINFDNIESNNTYNLLGLNPSMIPNIYYNNIVGSNIINLNTPIFESNIFKIDVIKNSYEGTFLVHPPNYTIINLCSLIQNKLYIGTQLSWQVSYNSSTDRVSIVLNSPNYKFVFFWTNIVMYNISKSLGFSTDNQDTQFITSTIGTFKPSIDTVLSIEDNLFLNTQQTNITVLDNNIEFSAETTNSNTFINNLKNLLEKNTNLNWDISISDINNKITLKLLNNDNLNNEYMFQILFSNSSMARIAAAMGFTQVDTTLSISLTGSSAVNNNVVLNPDDLFKIKIQQTYKRYVYKKYSIPLSKPVYNPKECLEQIKQKLINITNNPWTISSNVGSSINNNSYLQIKVNDVDSSFRFLWGNVYTGNLAKSMGFANVDMTTFNDNIVSGNIIDFNYNLDYNDRLYFQTKSNIYYTLTDIKLPTRDDEYRLNDYILNLPKYLFEKTGQEYIVELINEKVNISVKNSNTSFRLLFGQSEMKDIAKMLGFNPVNQEVYSRYVVSDNKVDNSILLTSEDIFFSVQKIMNSSSIIKQNIISLNQSYITPSKLISNLQNLLNQKTGKDWTVSVLSNILTIKVNSPNCAFQILWAEQEMNDIARSFGFNLENQTTFLNTITGVSPINLSIVYTVNNEFLFNFRDTNVTYSNPKQYIYNVSPYLYNAQSFIDSLPKILFDLTGKLFRVIYNTITKKITIAIDSSNSYFKIQWQHPTMLKIAQMMGFNPLETPEYTTITVGQNIADLSITLNNSMNFYITIQDKTNINYDVILKEDVIFIDPDFFYPVYFFNFISNQINSNLVIPLTFNYNTTTKKITISSTNKFQIDFGNMTNLAQIMGFDFIISPSYEYSFTGQNAVNMTLSVLEKDLFNVKFLKSFTSYQFNFYDFYAEYHNKLLNNYLYKYTALLWKSSYDVSTKKISVNLYSNKYRFILSDNLMKTINTIYGFDTNSTQSFSNTQIGNFKMSFSTYSNGSLVRLPELFDPLNAVIVYSLEPNNNTPILYSILFEPIFFTPTNLCNYFQNILNIVIPGLGFVVSYNNNTKKITISTTFSLNKKFRLFLGKSNFVSLLLGFNNSNISDYSNTITSEKEVIMTAQFSRIIIDPKSIIEFNKITLHNLQLPILENITDYNNTLKFVEKVGNATTLYTVRLIPGYYTNITTTLQNALNSAGGAGVYTVSLSNNRLTISVIGCQFVIAWTKNTVLATMCGFNFIDTPNYTNSITSDFNIDLVYPKVVYLDIEGVKFQSQFINNKHMFLINLSNPSYGKSIVSTNNQLNKIIFSLYDENNYLVSLVNNWNATIEFS